MKLTKNRYLIILIVLFTILVSEVVLIMQQSNDSIDMYIENIQSNIVTLMNISIKNKLAATQTLKGLILDEGSKEILKSANEATDIELETLRSEMYDNNINKINELEAIGIDLVHFHLSDTQSFLRMNTPEVVGGDLKTFRPSIEYTMMTQEVNHGFEEGITFSGYRYVYPIIYEEVYIGSVEFGFSLDRMLSPVEKTYHLETLLVLNEEGLENPWAEPYRTHSPLSTI